MSRTDVHDEVDWLWVLFTACRRAGDMASALTQTLARRLPAEPRQRKASAT
ncbi:MAG TPA: hypothetical protein VLX59_18840 [Acidimicrobiales bacterium]|nr:hypothetical protein [Acidimicrobiales bacterium]